jgi:hypothetical protein
MPIAPCTPSMKRTGSVFSSASKNPPPSAGAAGGGDVDDTGGGDWWNGVEGGDLFPQAASRTNVYPTA